MKAYLKLDSKLYSLLELNLNTEDFESDLNFENDFPYNIINFY